MPTHEWDQREFESVSDEFETFRPRWVRIEKALTDRGVDAGRVSLGVKDTQMPLDILEALLGL